jgi:cAMP-dependent protein kinase regulator
MRNLKKKVEYLKA